MTDPIDAAVRAFTRNVADTLSLADLDRGFMRQTIQAIEERDDRLRRAGIDSHLMLAGNTLQKLRRIRDNDSLRPGFQALVNQSVVLLASYFASGVSQLFRTGLLASLDASPSQHLREFQLKLSVSDFISMATDWRERLPDVVCDSPGLSFQDTKSIARAFEDFLDVTLPRDSTTNNVSAALALRHVLVHNGGVVDRACIRQLQHLHPRTLRSDISSNERLQFTSQEVTLIAEQMQQYVDRLAAGLIAALQRTDEPAE